jgi:Transposase IS116/IS110/IS902 family
MSLWRADRPEFLLIEERRDWASFDGSGELEALKKGNHRNECGQLLGLIPREYSSGGKQRMDGISKQGNRLLRFLLVEVANSIKHEMFELQVVLLMCWMNHLNCKTEECGRQT